MKGELGWRVTKHFRPICLARATQFMRLSAAITAMAISRGIAPPTINHDNPDPECDLDYVPNTAREMKINYALSNSFGFGGHNACLLVQRFNG